MPYSKTQLEVKVVQRTANETTPLFGCRIKNSALVQALKRPDVAKLKPRPKGETRDTDAARLFGPGHEFIVTKRQWCWEQLRKTGVNNRGVCQNNNAEQILCLRCRQGKQLLRTFKLIHPAAGMVQWASRISLHPRHGHFSHLHNALRWLHECIMGCRPSKSSRDSLAQKVLNSSARSLYLEGKWVCTAISQRQGCNLLEFQCCCAAIIVPIKLNYVSTPWKIKPCLLSNSRSYVSTMGPRMRKPEGSC